jgi:hypothetical protein
LGIVSLLGGAYLTFLAVPFVRLLGRPTALLPGLTMAGFGTLLIILTIRNIRKTR